MHIIWDFAPPVDEVKGTTNRCVAVGRPPSGTVPAGQRTPCCCYSLSSAQFPQPSTPSSRRRWAKRAGSIARRSKRRRCCATNPAEVKWARSPLPVRISTTPRSSMLSTAGGSFGWLAGSPERQVRSRKPSAARGSSPKCWHSSRWIRSRSCKVNGEGSATVMAGSPERMATSRPSRHSP
jgi:hypothetical protein